MDSNPQRKSFFKGGAGLTIALAALAVLLKVFPAYRWFFLISVGIGILVAAILYFWHKLRPVKEEDIDHKRPLGL